MGFFVPKIPLNTEASITGTPPPVTGDWIIANYTVCDSEVIPLYGDLIIQNGGHLILQNTELLMMSQYLQPYDIIVEEGGIMEIYDSYITDPPDDDDTELLSSYYYFIVREGSTLIIENSTVRQHGFIDFVNPEHLGLSISTNSGHISNSRINSTIIGLAFFGNNTGFYVENTNISQIGMTAIMLDSAEGVILNNISFSDTQESSVVDAQTSGNFIVENINLVGEQFIRADYSYGFEVRNIISNGPERVFEIRDSDDFKISGVNILNPQNWNRRIEIERCSNFTLDDVNDNNDSNVIFIGESSHGAVSNLTGLNITWMIDSEKSDNITVKDVNVGGNEYVFRFTDSEHITMDNITIDGGMFPIYFDTVNNSSISNLIISDFSDAGVSIRDYSYNISVTDAYIETSSIEFTKGILIDYGFDVYVRNLETHNLNISLTCRYGSVHTEDILIDGTLEQKYGIKLTDAEDSRFSNISIINKVQYGFYLMNCLDDNTRLNNVYIKDSDYGIYLWRSNISIDKITIDFAINDVWADGSSTATIMNSTVKQLRMDSAEIICINTTNTTAASFFGISQLIIKWWVDVFVSDNAGPIVGALVFVVDGLFVEDAKGYTGSDGFVRNLAATEVIWTVGPTPDYKNPHKSEANGPGWFADNLTFYQVDRNMWVNVTYNGDAPPFEPTNIQARSDEMSNTILTWDPSISLDVIGYKIYFAYNFFDLWNYVDFGTPNGTVTGTNYTHLGGSANWDRFYYSVLSYDNENKSQLRNYVSCGDWVVNSSSPQNVGNMIINMNGSLRIYGDLQLTNINLYFYSDFNWFHGINIHNTGWINADNLTVNRKFINFPYYFKINSDAEVIINNSEIIQPGADEGTDDLTNIGIHSQTNNLTISNSEIDVRFGGLGIYDVDDFNGLLYNITFITSFVIEHAEFLLRVVSSVNVTIDNCSFDGVTKYGIHAEASSEMGILKNQIQVQSYTQSPAYGIYLAFCDNSRIYDNPLIRGNPAIYIYSSTNITVENSNISGHSLYGIHVESSWLTTISECYFDTNEDPEIGIFMSWCSESTIRDMESAEVNFFLHIENESMSTIENLSITSGDLAVTMINSNDILVKDVHIYFISNGMMIIGGHEITLQNLTVNLTLFGMLARSAGPIYLINSTLANCISGELVAEGYEGEAGNIIVENSTIAPIAQYSLILNESAVVHLINTPFNISKANIKDGASRLEIYHYLSVQVYDIDNNIPAWANITIMSEKGDVIFDETAISGYAEWIMIHEKTVFRDNTYLDNPHNILVFDGSHLGNLEVYINFSQHVDVQVSNQFPIITLIGIIGYFDNPFPIPDDITFFPKTDYDIVLSYTYEDPENDPESGTTIHWYVNGVYNSTFDGMNTITPQYTQKGQLWQAYVYPSDGYNTTYPFYAFESNIIPIMNTPPSVSNVTITPSEPTGGDDLFVSFEVYDLDDDGLDSSKTTSKWYRWEVNDWMYSSIDSFFLPSQYTSKGEIWKCVITPHDGDDSGAALGSANVTIGNTAPWIQNARITTLGGSTQITGANNLKVQYIFLDADLDLENGTSYEWQYQRVGSSWTSVSVNSSVLPNSYTQRGDLWKCKIIPKDDEDFGTEVITDAVEIFNTPPLITNVTIIPNYATSENILEVTYDFYDYDGDSDNGTSFRWVYEDALGSKESGIHGNVTPYGILVKEQIWYCFVIPSDGIGSGAEIRSDGVEIHNSPPWVDQAEINVVLTDIGMHLEVVYNSDDIDGDNTDTVEIRWYKNQDPQSQFDDNTTVSEDYLVKDDSWEVEVRIFDGLNWSGWFKSEPQVVPNTAPELSGVPSLSPSKAKSSEDLIPSFSALYEDPDGDSLSTWEIWWYRDNGHMEDYDDMQQISSDLTTKGEIWYYKVRVSDGEDFSEWFSSTTSLIENSPPTNITLSHEEPVIILTETDTEEFQVSADDTDSDTLSFRWTLDGRIVLFEEGVSNSIYLHKTDYDSEGEYILRLVISDSDDTYETTWNLNILKRNRLPEIRVVEPEGKTASIKEGTTLNFAITKSDADGDSMEVIWYIDGVKTFEGSDKYTYSPNFNSEGSKNITVEVSETESNASSIFSWDIAVADVPEGGNVEKILGLSYDAWGLIMAAISGLVAILLFLFGFMRVKKKKGRLKEHMVEMDKILSEDEDPDVIEDKLVDFEAQIREEFSQGKLEDLHFLMLEEIISSRKGEVRKAEVTQKFGRLPKNVLQDLDKMLEDGNITKEEYEDFVSTISKSESLSPAQKAELSTMIGEWEAEDKDGEEGDRSKERPKKDEEQKESSTEKEEPKKEDEENESPSEKEEPKEDIDEEIDKIVNSLDED
jgi:parallel beta-helix repeat protein